MDVFELKNETATRWAFGSREIKNDLNYLEEAGAETLTARALDELAGKIGNSWEQLGKVWIDKFSAWVGGALWACYPSQDIADIYTIKGGYVLRCACVVGLALLLVFQQPNTEKERIYRVIG